MRVCGSKKRRRNAARLAVALSFCVFTLPVAYAAEHVSLSNGFDFICDHRTTVGDRTRLFPTADKDNFVEVATADITAVEEVTLPPVPVAAVPETQAIAKATGKPLTPAELHELLTVAGASRNLDVDLLACVVHAESGGRANAVSHAGARGLMQLMPGTAAELGVTNSFEPGQNINGGTAYLNSLLVRYHDDLALALAAYNAGPKAVDKYHGVPPYPETRAYVARIIREFNQRKAAAEKLATQTQHASNRMPGSTAASSVPSL